MALFTLPLCKKIAGLTVHRLLSTGLLGIIFSAVLLLAFAAASALFFYLSYKQKPNSSKKTILSLLSILFLLAALALLFLTGLLIFTKVFGPGLYNRLFGIFGCA